jgi:copper chaperone
MTTDLKIEGMTCQMCVQHVTKALQSVNGVENVNVDLAAGSATVHHQNAPLASLIGAVEEEGYTAREAGASAI